jgi:hypothetical protein
MVHKVSFIVGNSYEKIPSRLREQSRSGIYKKHDVEIFVDIIDGNHDIVQKVTFDLGSSFRPQTFDCSTPICTKTSFGNTVWRFATRQQVYGSFQANVKIRGRGGTAMTATHTVLLDPRSEYNSHSNDEGRLEFLECNELRPFKYSKMPDGAKFGLELELSSAMDVMPEDVADSLSRGRTQVHLIQDYSSGIITLEDWKLVPDSSIVCSISQPECNKFELVSPPLVEGAGLEQVHVLLRRLGDIRPHLKVNKSMGFHVHVDVSAYSTPQLVKICQQFVKYEEVMDMFMPPSRRSGSLESNQYFQSNRKSVELQHGFTGPNTNREIHDALGECHDIASLVSVMNRDGRYYKLNMQNLASGRQPTIEFRQHSATMNVHKVNAWIRFCVLFCVNSAKLRTPTPLVEDGSIEKKFDGLFQFVVKDRALREFYSKRMDEVANDVGDGCECCTECHSGSGAGCESKLL